MTRYTPKYRPPLAENLPRLKFTLLEAPSYWPNSPAPPSEHRHGVVQFERNLTEAEIQQYQLEVL